MPATYDDMIAVTRGEFVLDTQESATIKARHIGARDTGVDPRPSWFDSIDAATVLNAEAFALVGTERRRFAVPLEGDQTAALDGSQQTPTTTFVDATLAADGPFLVARLELDLDAERTNLELFG